MVYITLLPNHAVEILGFDDDRVEAAQSHYITLVNSARAKSNVSRVANMILDEREGIDVVFLQAHDWWPNLDDMVVPQHERGGRSGLASKHARAVAGGGAHG